MDKSQFGFEDKIRLVLTVGTLLLISGQVLNVFYLRVIGSGLLGVVIMPCVLALPVFITLRIFQRIRRKGVR